MAKEIVKIRERKLKNGNISLFLETYTEGVKKYEWLRLYIIPDTEPNAKELNQIARRAAETIKAKRIIEIANTKAGIVDTAAAGRVLFKDFVAAYLMKKERRGQSTTNTKNFYSHFLKSGLNENTKLSQIDKNFCLKFIDYLKYKSGLKQTSQNNYQTIFNAILNDAERNGMIANNPIKKIDTADKIRAERPQREFLTIDEVKTLIETPTIYQKAKRIFLFSTFCGLRFSDMNQLKWGDIVDGEDGRKYARIIQKKTKKPLFLPLCVEALKWLPERPQGATDETNVFGKLYASYLNLQISKWVNECGLKKHVSIHTARHTFATMLLTLGTDIYTISKLLGHTNITTTQIYAQIVDTKKTNAVGLLDKVF